MKTQSENRNHKSDRSSKDKVQANDPDEFPEKGV